MSAGVRHSIGGADYGSVRAGAFMGLRIMNQLQTEHGLAPLGQLFVLFAHLHLFCLGVHQGSLIELQSSDPRNLTLQLMEAKEQET